MKMKYALVNGERQEPKPGLSGKCELHGCPVIAKCGKVKVWHWAHKGKLMCDQWWENETLWHRAWKDCFPKEWQEVIQHAENGEKHIADVKTDNDYAIEFQHSFITPEERQSREAFYKKMIWIVDGTRRLRDKGKFIDVLKQSHAIDNKIELRRLCYFFDECALLWDWSGSTAPVFFDLGEDILWGLLPKTIEERYVFRIKRNELISYLLAAPQMSFEALLQGLNNLLILKKKLHSVRQSSRPRHTNDSRSLRQLRLSQRKRL